MKTKLCTKCGVKKSLSEFHKNKSMKYGLNYYCKECYKSDSSKKRYLLLASVPNGFKICSKCKEIKLLNCFYNKNETSDKLTSWCKSCTLKNNKNWHDKNKERTRIWNKNYSLMKEYGITLDQYEQMLKEQNGVCAICSKKESAFNHVTKRVWDLAVDHEHKTGKIRGLLCRRCNQTIGLLYDDISLIKQMAKYVEK